MTLEEFIKKFRNHTAGVIALGTTSARKLLAGTYDQPERVGQAVNDLSDTTTQLLTVLYNALKPPQKAPEPTKK